ncbi:MAG: ABC transporter permease [Tahibacter sp.]
MIADFVHSFQSEWIKQKRSLASWMVIAGGFFTPAIVIVIRLLYHDELPRIYAADGFWQSLWNASWESAAIFFLPMGAILATSLITQIEFKNNTWKQVHALPLHLAVIYVAKLAIILLMLALFFVLFNLGIYLSAIVPYLLVPGVSFPSAPFPYANFLKEDGLFYVDCLPIVALQYMISLRYRNFLVPVGIGFMLWVGTLGSLPWKWAFVLPYSYTILNYLKNEPHGKAAIPLANIHGLAIGYFLLFAIVGFWMFATRKEKG